MTFDMEKEKAFCDECISHLLENAGPDHIIVKYRDALTAIERLQAENDSSRRVFDGLGDFLKERGLLDGSTAGAYSVRNAIEKQATRIRDLEAENENHLQWGISNATDAAKLRVRIEDLEDWLVEERSLAIQQNPNRTREYSDAESIDLARQQLIARGKIGPDDKSTPPAEMSSCQETASSNHIVEPNEMVCGGKSASSDHPVGSCKMMSPDEQVGTGVFLIGHPMPMLTKEQRKALDAIRDLVTSETRSDYIDAAVDVLDKLLSAPPAWEVTEERKAALEELIEHCRLTGNPDTSVLRSMLGEARP